MFVAVPALRQKTKNKLYYSLNKHNLSALCQSWLLYTSLQ